MKNILHTLILTTSLLALATPALAQSKGYTYTPSATERVLVVNKDGQAFAQVPVPCKPGKVLPYDATRLVATCEGKPGLLILDVSDPAKPNPVEIQSTEGKIPDIYLVGAQLWVELEGQGAKPLKLTAAVASTPATTPTPPAKPAEPAEPAPTTPEAPAEQPPQDNIPKAVGEVLKGNAREIVISVGKAAGFAKGDAIELYELRDVELEGEKIQKEEMLAIGRIKSVTEERAIVEVGLNEKIPVGAKARISRHQGYTPNLTSPPRTPGITEYTLTIRPFLPLGALGVGGIFDASITHRFDAPVAVDVIIAPLGIALTNKGNETAFSGHAFLSYDAQVFQLGLGVGLARFEKANLPFNIPAGESAPQTHEVGFSAAQYVRLGARDGFNLTAQTNFVIRGDEFDFGGLSAQLQLPTSVVIQDTWLILRGGGGLPGHVYAEIGLRNLVKGNGQEGSLFVTPTIGGASISSPIYEKCNRFDGTSDEQCKNSQIFGGPMIGVTLEWR